MALSDIVDFFEKIKPVTEVVAPVAGAVLANSATGDALKAQQAGADKSAEIAKYMYDTSRHDLAPYRAGGNAANNRLLELMGISPNIDRETIKANILKRHGNFFSTGQQQAAAPVQTSPQAAAPINYSFGNQMTLGTTGNSLFDRLGTQDRINYVMSQDGKKNKYNGQTVNAAQFQQDLPLAIQGGRGLMGIQQASGQLMTPEQKAARERVQNNMYAAEYDPTSSLFDRLLPMAALALMTGGLGAGASALAGPVAAGGVAPATAANLVKGAISGSRMLAGK